MDDVLANVEGRTAIPSGSTAIIRQAVPVDVKARIDRVWYGRRITRLGRYAVAA